MECKNFNGKFEVKKEDDEFIHLEGLASTFGNVDSQNDIIVQGAFTDTLVNSDIKIKLLNQHRSDQPIGLVESAIQNGEGLFIKAIMPKKNSQVQDLLPLLKMGAIANFSIGYSVKDSEFTDEGIRLLKEIELHEVSIVTFPANDKANITSVKSLEVGDVEGIKTKKEFEKLLLSTNAFSRKAAVVLASHFKEEQSDSAKEQDKKQRESVEKEEKKQRESVEKEQRESALQASIDEIDKLKQIYKKD